MQYRQLVRLAALTAFVLFISTPSTYAQRARNTVISENLESGQISGKVSGTDGPMAGVRVVISHEGNGIVDVITTATGTYDFKELRPGKYDISFFKEGYRKRIIQKVPIVERHITACDVNLLLLNSWKEERNPEIHNYEELNDNKIEKMK